MIKRNCSPVKNYIIHLNSILKNDKLAIQTIANELKTRGYTFIKMPPKLVQEINVCLMIIQIFFSENLAYKKRFFKEPIFGYFNVDHKESFRFLTGKRINEHKMPIYFGKLKEFIGKMDLIMRVIALNCANVLFPNLSSLPFFNKNKPWGMLDITKYHNDGSRKGLNCNEHYDPGLLSLSFCSTQPGLQLKDEFGRWIKPAEDKNIAVLWAGKAANNINHNIKPCYHRVVNINNKPRIAMWHEICTYEQEHTELISIVKKKNIPFEFEAKTGIPMSKSAPLQKN